MEDKIALIASNKLSTKKFYCRTGVVSPFEFDLNTEIVKFDVTIKLSDVNWYELNGYTDATR